VASKISIIVIIFLLCASPVFAQNKGHDEYINLADFTLERIQEELRIALRSEKSDDIEFVDDTDGIILKDRTTGGRYRLYITGSGTVATEEVT